VTCRGCHVLVPTSRLRRAANARVFWAVCPSTGSGREVVMVCPSTGSGRPFDRLRAHGDTLRFDVHTCSFPNLHRQVGDEVEAGSGLAGEEPGTSC
jgi:hypothetical protein